MDVLDKQYKLCLQLKKDKDIYQKNMKVYCEDIIKNYEKANKKYIKQKSRNWWFRGNLGWPN